MQIHDEVEEVRHLETTFSDCCPSSEINFIQVIIKLHKFIFKYILSKCLLTIKQSFGVGPWPWPDVGNVSDLTAESIKFLPEIGFSSW